MGAEIPVPLHSPSAALSFLLFNLFGPSHTQKVLIAAAVFSSQLHFKEKTALRRTSPSKFKNSRLVSWLALITFVCDALLHCCSGPESVAIARGKKNISRPGQNTAVGLCIFRIKLRPERGAFGLELNRLSDMSSEHSQDLQLGGTPDCRGHPSTCTSPHPPLSLTLVLFVHLAGSHIGF